MTKIALLSDIHGNTTALEAVLEDAKRAGVEEYWLLGDVLMPGTGRRHLLNLLEELPITVQILGNWEDSLWRAMKGMLDPSRASHRYLMRHCQYILEEIRPEEIEAMQSLPMQVHRKVSGLRVGITHHLPDKNWGRELIHIGDQKDFDRLVTNPPCDIAVYGHIHQQFFRYGSGGELILNPGSIGQPFFLQANLRKDLRAMYAILEFDESGLKDVDFRRVSYDIEKKLPYFQVYYESLVNGVHHTHNHELLHEIAQREGHNVEVDAWLRDFFN